MKQLKRFTVVTIFLLVFSYEAWAKGIPFLGFIPETVNFSDLELPSIEFTDEKIHAARYLPKNFLNNSANTSTLPEYPSYENANMPNIKNQNPYGTCWAFAAIGAAEINTIKQGLISNPDFSELHLAWFCYKDPGKSFSLYSSNGILDQGGNSTMSTAFLSRVAGPVNESELPYENATSSSSIDGVKINATDYTFSGIRLTDASRIDFQTTTTDAQRDNIKNMILKNGAVITTYYAGSGAFSSPGGEASYYVPGSNMINHAVLIVGWDDSYSRTNFETQPSQDGAWLVRNSWGENSGNDGYFWMSYSQYIGEAVACSFEKSEDGLKHYGNDYLGMSGTTGNGKTAWIAKIFTAAGSEAVTQVGFYTTDNSTEYEVRVYAGAGKSGSNPVGGTLAAQKSGTFDYAGYHTVDVDPVPLGQNQNFSVVLKLSNKQSTTPIAFSYSTGTGYFSLNGTTWQTLNSNPCIKAFTVPSNAAPTPEPDYDNTVPDDETPSPAPTPEPDDDTPSPEPNPTPDDDNTPTPIDTPPFITTTNLPEGYAGSNYEAIIKATGSGTIKLSVDGLPSWLNFTDNGNGTGTLKGRPNNDDYGIYTVSVTASNASWRSINQFPITIWRSEDSKDWDWDWDDLFDDIVDNFFDGNGGGGCNSGLGLLALSALTMLMLRKFYR